MIVTVTRREGGPKNVCRRPLSMVPNRKRKRERLNPSTAEQRISRVGLRDSFQLRTSHKSMKGNGESRPGRTFNSGKHMPEKLLKSITLAA